MADRFTVRFKSHSNSIRIYEAFLTESGAAHFLAAALKNSGWLVVETIREVEGAEPIE